MKRQRKVTWEEQVDVWTLPSTLLDEEERKMRKPTFNPGQIPGLWFG